MDDEIDIDGDDAGIFGDAQFTEGDIILPESLHSTEDEEVRVDSDDDDVPLAKQHCVGMSLRDLVTGKIVLKADATGVATSGTVFTVSFVRFCAAAPSKRKSTGCSSTGRSYVPHMSRCICRAHSVDGLLAYVLQRLLASLPWVDEVVPHL